ncbi:MAG: DUF1045 domain-containing protein [Pseudomonadota bacterium]
MTAFRRYGIYVVPDGALFDLGSAWLGWDSAAGAALPHPAIDGLPAPAKELTATPRKYGLHGTIKPPFRLAEGQSAKDLGDALTAFCATRPAVTIPALMLRLLGRFIALVPDAPAPGLADLAAATVEAFEPFRAPLNEAELAKRRKSRLTDRQEVLLQRWGYPYVMEEFRFHITLTGALEAAAIDPVLQSLKTHFSSHIGQPLPINHLSLMGEDADGRFHVIARYALTG